jgi:hypothetical protein
VLALNSKLIVSSSGTTVVTGYLTDGETVLRVTGEDSEHCITQSHAKELVGGTLAGAGIFSKARALWEFGRRAVQAVRDNKEAIQGISGALAKQSFLPGVASAAEQFKEHTGYGLMAPARQRKRTIEERLGMA